MVQSKEDVRNRWERSTLEGGRGGVEEGGGRKGREREERKKEREGGEGEVRENKQKSKTRFPMKATGCTHLAPHRLVCADV